VSVHVRSDGSLMEVTIATKSPTLVEIQEEQERRESTSSDWRDDD